MRTCVCVHKGHKDKGREEGWCQCEQKKGGCRGFACMHLRLVYLLSLLKLAQTDRARFGLLLRHVVERGSVLGQYWRRHAVDQHHPN